jgi:hypothetical protein
MNRKSLIRKLPLGAVVFFTAFLIILGMLRVYEPITRHFPVSQSQFRLAKARVTKNTDWKPTIHHFNNMHWAVVPSQM